MESVVSSKQRQQNDYRKKAEYVAGDGLKRTPHGDEDEIRHRIDGIARAQPARGRNDESEKGESKDKIHGRPGHFEAASKEQHERAPRTLQPKAPCVLR